MKVIDLARKSVVLYKLGLMSFQLEVLGLN